MQSSCVAWKYQYLPPSHWICAYFCLFFVFFSHSFGYSSPPSILFLYLFYCLSLCSSGLISLSSSFSFVCLSQFKCSLTCPCTITKPACLFILHLGITLFFRHYFFEKSLRYDLPQTARHRPTLIIFSHSATQEHNDAHAHTFSHQTHSVCVFVLSQHWFLSVLKWKAACQFRIFFGGVFTAFALIFWQMIK